ncbi:MAG: O-antigen ligase family protein [Prevotella sp.]|nr:O-antigen ligase family protein [Prevotella sp.]
MKISTSLAVRLFFLSMLFILAVTACFDMRMMEATDLGATGRYMLALAYVAWLGSLLKLNLPGYNIYKPSAPIIFYAIFFLWTVFPTVMSEQESMAYNLMLITLPLLVLLSTYNTVRYGGSHKWHHIMFCVMLAMLVIQYVMVFSFVNLFADDNFGLTASYFTLYMLPLVFLCKSKTVRIVATLVVAIVIISSLKRSGVVAFVLAFMAYIIVNQYVKKKLSPAAILGVIAILVLFITLFVVFASMGENSVMERFENIGNDNGSGRLVVWEMTGKLISRLDAGSLLVGQGYNMVLPNSPMSLSAHNDFLEILYDYGLIGLGLYVCAFLSVCYYTLKMLAAKSAYAPAMTMLMVIYVIQSMISHIIIYFWGSLFMLSFAYIIGNYQREDAGYE